MVYRRRLGSILRPQNESLLQSTIRCKHLQQLGHRSQIKPFATSVVGTQSLKHTINIDIEPNKYPSHHSKAHRDPVQCILATETEKPQHAHNVQQCREKSTVVNMSADETLLTLEWADGHVRNHTP
jgi:hypothetical protein